MEKGPAFYDTVTVVFTDLARNSFEDLNSAHAHFKRPKLIHMLVYA